MTGIEIGVYPIKPLSKTKDLNFPASSAPDGAPPESK